MLPLKKPENKRTSAEKAIRNSVFMLVIVYVASLTWLFLNSQINVVNAESDLVSAQLSANVISANTGSLDENVEDSDNVEDVVEEDTDLVEDQVVDL